MKAKSESERKELFEDIVSYKKLALLYRRYVFNTEVLLSRKELLDLDSDILFSMYYKIFNLILQDLSMSRNTFFKSVVIEYVNKALYKL